MNKQLEEAKENIEIFIEDYKIAEEVVDGNFIDSLETVLKEIERLQEENKNSIPKDKIREKIEEIENLQARVKNNNLIYSREDVFRFQIYILEELLEEK